LIINYQSLTSIKKNQLTRIHNIVSIFYYLLYFSWFVDWSN